LKNTNCKGVSSVKRHFLSTAVRAGFRSETTKTITVSIAEETKNSHHQQFIFTRNNTVFEIQDLPEEFRVWRPPPDFLVGFMGGLLAGMGFLLFVGCS
jgi:hypothetical protein